MTGRADERGPGGPSLLLGPIEPPVGGVSRYGDALARLLVASEFATERLDLTKTSSRDLGISRSPLRRVAKRLAGGPSYALRSAVTRHRPRLVIDNHAFLWTEADYGSRVREIVDAPYVLVIHDGAFPDAARAGLPASLDWISGAVCMSEAIRAALAEIAPDVRSAQLSPLISPAPTPAEVSWPTSLSDFFRRHDTVIATSGALAEHYGLSDVFEAYDRLRSQDRAPGLVVLLGSFADEPASAESLRWIVDRWGHDDVLALTDFADGPGVIARSDVYVRPSRLDSFGLALHEAMQAGVPVVAARHETRPAGASIYEPGNAEELAAALIRALTPEAVTAARAQAADLPAIVERNREDTLAFLRGVRA
jgi:glycosyltransferase involved in cell wall biosynthesis